MCNYLQKIRKPPERANYRDSGLILKRKWIIGADLMEIRPRIGQARHIGSICQYRSDVDDGDGGS
jgi:hypothetical protein